MFSVLVFSVNFNGILSVFLGGPGDFGDAGSMQQAMKQTCLLACMVHRSAG